MPRFAARSFVALYRHGARGRAKLFSVLAGGAFAEFGRNSVVQTPL
jgi:hypothetical protein